MYKLNNKAELYGTSLKGYVRLDFTKMVDLFGIPEIGDGYKVSGEWTFENKKGYIFTVYDWKSTSLYDDSLPDVDSFRTSGVNTYNVGGQKDASDFIEWLETKLLKGK